MNMRKHKRARQELQARHLAWRKAFLAEVERWHAEAAHYLYEDDEYHDRLSCTHCGGEGYCEVDDPFWDDCDEFGYGPCTYCHGTGDRAHQTVF